MLAFYAVLRSRCELWRWAPCTREHLRGVNTHFTGICNLSMSVYGQFYEPSYNQDKINKPFHELAHSHTHTLTTQTHISVGIRLEPLPPSSSSTSYFHTGGKKCGLPRTFAALYSLQSLSVSLPRSNTPNRPFPRFSMASDWIQSSDVLFTSSRSCVSVGFLSFFFFFFIFSLHACIAILLSGEQSLVQTHIRIRLICVDSRCTLPLWNTAHAGEKSCALNISALLCDSSMA